MVAHEARGRDSRGGGPELSLPNSPSVRACASTESSWEGTNGCPPRQPASAKALVTVLYQRTVVPSAGASPSRSEQSSMCPAEDLTPLMYCPLPLGQGLQGMGAGQARALVAQERGVHCPPLERLLGQTQQASKRQRWAGSLGLGALHTCNTAPGQPLLPALGRPTIMRGLCLGTAFFGRSHHPPAPPNSQPPCTPP